MRLPFYDFSVMEKKEVLLHLANCLKELRKKKGVSQEFVNDKTGVHIARIEHGSRDITFSTLVKLADFFEVSLDYFDLDK